MPLLIHASGIMLFSWYAWFRWTSNPEVWTWETKHVITAICSLSLICYVYISTFMLANKPYKFILDSLFILISICLMYRHMIYIFNDIHEFISKEEYRNLKQFLYLGLDVAMVIFTGWWLMQIAQECFALVDHPTNNMIANNAELNWIY